MDSWQAACIPSSAGPCARQQACVLLGGGWREGGVKAEASLSPTLPVCPSRLGWCLQVLPTLGYSHGLEEEQRGQAAVSAGPNYSLLVAVSSSDSLG